MSYIRPAVLILLLLSLITGGLYPWLTTTLSQLLFNRQANGSLLLKQQHPVGSAIIGQSFTKPGYFWGRPSVTDQSPYNPLASGGSNFSTSNPRLHQQIKERAAIQHKANPHALTAIPVELLTASASGLDPHLSPDAAYYQVARIAAARHLPAEEIRRIIDQHIEQSTLAFLWPPKVNILKLNLALDKLSHE
ncbi:MAG: potassium-transporting ATPase subunit KdpC [Enterobacteriaceae bacterium]